MSKLEFKISSTELVNNIICIDSYVFTSSPELHLAVVTLTGNISEDAIIFINPAGYSAVCCIKEESGYERLKFSFPCAISFHDKWQVVNFLQEKGISQTSIIRLEEEKVGPFEIKLGFLIPDKINEFYISYPALISEKAIISKEPTENLIIPFNVEITGILINNNRLPIVNERLWIGAYLWGGFEVTVDERGETINPFDDTDSSGHFNIEVDSKFVKDRNEFALSTAGFTYIRKFTILERNKNPIIIIIVGKNSTIDLGEIIYNKK